MKSWIACAALSLTLVGSAAFADMPSISDKEFVLKAAVGNTFEIEESKLALQHATDARLKRFAEKMIADHTSALKKLEAAGSKVGDKVEMMLDKPHQAIVDNLKTFTGTDFDKIYTADQVASHAETVSLLSDYKQNGQNKELKSWVDKTLPVVKEHQAMINAM